MVNAKLERLWCFLQALFPERHIYMRCDGRVQGLVLTTGKQVMASAVLAIAALWMGACTASMLVATLSASPADQATIHARNYYERLIADRQARLNSAMAQLNDTSGSIVELARSTERRHAALALLIADARGDPGLNHALAPAPLQAFASRSPLDGVRAVRDDQERLIGQAQTFAKSRADRLRLALRLAGLDPAAYSPAQGDSLGGPLIDAKDPRALAAVLDVDDAFAERVQRAALDLSATHALQATVDTLPLAKPTVNTVRASGFGVRIDPFTGRPAFHAGLDFAGPMMTPIYSTAPGVVSFTGVRTGYGNTVEIDHGRGLKTRYAHLAAIGVQVGQHVALGQRIASMGSTGRSTGPHLHYEVWVAGRPQNPQRFLEAGDYVQQANE